MYLWLACNSRGSCGCLRVEDVAMTQINRDLCVFHDKHTIELSLMQRNAMIEPLQIWKIYGEIRALITMAIEISIISQMRYQIEVGACDIYETICIWNALSHRHQSIASDTTAIHPAIPTRSCMFQKGVRLKLNIGVCPCSRVDNEYGDWNLISVHASQMEAL